MSSDETTAPTLTDPEERLADLIAEHGDYHVNDDCWTVCICGHVAVGDDDDGSHARHVARVVLAAERARTAEVLIEAFSGDDYEENARAAAAEDEWSWFRWLAVSTVHARLGSTVPARFEAEITAEALREAADAVGPALQNEVGSGHTSTYSVRRWLRDRADRLDAEPAPDAEPTGPGRCAACGKNPAEGYASVWTAEHGERWYCHPDEGPSCYSGDRAEPAPDADAAALARVRALADEWAQGRAPTAAAELRAALADLDQAGDDRAAGGGGR